jgi:hypothetical protein
MLFILVQFLDIVFATLILFGVENLRITPGYTESNPYDLYDMPFSHSLGAALAWTLMVGVIALTFSSRAAFAIALAGAVFSHWILDVPVHVHDLPILGNTTMKLGLGLWKHRWITVALELAILFSGWFIYHRTANAKRWSAKQAVFILFLAIVAVATPFFPTPVSERAFAWLALATYAVLAALARWSEA